VSIVFFDLETGGLQSTHPNIQLAAIAVNDAFEEQAVFESKIAFDVGRADPEALKINHYSEEAWVDAPVVEDVADRFSRFIEPYKSIQMVSKRTGNPYSVARLAGHNAAAFDGPRIQAMYTSVARFLPAHPIPLDTLQLALWRYQKLQKHLDSFRLENLCNILGIESAGAHDALTDVRMTVQLAKKLLLGGEK